MKEDWRSRFWSKIDKRGENDCWEWSGYVKPDGYAQFHLNHKYIYVHRLAYMDAYSTSIPKGLMVEHKCHNRKCCNPSHFHLVTPQENKENLFGARHGNKSGIRGVVWDKAKNKWRVKVEHSYKQYSGGYFNNIKDAEQAAIVLRNKLMVNNLFDRAEHDTGIYANH